MRGHVLSPAAQADLGEIWDYSSRSWGEGQADRYILGIRRACEALADGTRQGRAIDEIRPGYRKLAAASHFLFYRVPNDRLIEAIRILHQRMDIAFRL